MPRGAQEYEERYVRTGYLPDTGISPTSALVWIDVNSMAGSGLRAFDDFGEAICWFWGACEDHRNAWIPDEQASIEVREGRRRFRALLARFVSDGYARDMEEELAEIVLDFQGYETGIPAYAVGSVSIFPADLDEYLDAWWGDPEEDDYFAELAAEGKPIPDFNFANPDHMEALERRIEHLMTL
jgi:hypothetical protein